VPPDPRPIPRFIADNSHEGIAYGRWAERLAESFREACGRIDDLPPGAKAPEEIDWFPERAWGGRVWVPATARAEAEEDAIEYFGHVSYVRPDDGDPQELKAHADFTDVLAEDNPDWRLDLNDDVIGKWRGEAGMGGDVTLIWGRPLVPGSAAVTAELEMATVDQEPVSGDRFSLVALDALTGYGDEIYLTVRLWSKRARELAAESLYEEAAPESAPEA
jgi:hypothetical protein